MTIYTESKKNKKLDEWLPKEEKTDDKL